MATFSLLHGAWHDPACWDLAAGRLEELGHDTSVPDLPLHDPSAGYEQRVRPAIEALEGAEEPVVVVAHSQSSALGPLVVAARPVSLLVYLCPRMGSVEPPPGAPDPFRAGIPFPSPRPDGTTAWDPETAQEAMYPRLPAERASALVEHLRPMAMPSDDYPLQFHPDVPTALVYATEDELFEPAFQRFIAEELLGIEPIALPGGHFPMAEDPDALAELLNRLAGNNGGMAEKDSTKEGSEGSSPAELIDARIEELGDWRGETLARVRAIVKQADPEVVEEWKWRGVPVWYHDGMICTGETYKKVVKMTFAKGASLEDPSGLFNSSLEGNTRRAIDIHEGEAIDEKALTALIRAAVDLNMS